MKCGKSLKNNVLHMLEKLIYSLRRENLKISDGYGKMLYSLDIIII